ncbi:uncharacterized protein [Cicer arietinum]|uniref:uncharacterized protein n=1 Tax=Cicer arietinum TaxID=3827 RepID=UPI003CC55993
MGTESYTYMGRSFNEFTINYKSTSSAFSDCNSDKSGGEFATTSSQSRRLLISRASENSDDFICQLVFDLHSSSIEDQKQAAIEIRRHHTSDATNLRSSHCGLEKGCEVKKKIQKESPNAEIILLEIDLSSLASVQRFYSEFLALELPLNILINNAGVYSQNIEFSEEKIEVTFVTNYLASILKFEGHNVPLEEELILKNDGLWEDNCGEDNMFIKSSYLKRVVENVVSFFVEFDVVLLRWREACGVVKNPKRRFRFNANLQKRGEAGAMRRTNQEKLRVAVLVSKAAFRFMQGGDERNLTTMKNAMSVNGSLQALSCKC